jgi:hypothetical protein
MGYVKVDEHCFENFLRDLQPFTLWFLPIHPTGAPKDAFESLIIEDIGAVTTVDMIAAQVTEVLFRCFRRCFFDGCCNKLSERFELDRECGVESMLGGKSSIGSLADRVDFASIGSESMPK